MCDFKTSGSWSFKTIWNKFNNSFCKLDRFIIVHHFHNRTKRVYLTKKLVNLLLNPFIELAPGFIKGLL
jgi:hypothetical protein